MKKFIGAIVLVTVTSMGSAMACSEIRADEMIIGSQSVRNLLDKASSSLKADCDLRKDEFEQPDLAVNYTTADETRTSGKVTRTFQGNVDCAKDDGSVLKRKITGSATIKFNLYEEDEYCEEMVNHEVLEIKAKMKI